MDIDTLNKLGEPHYLILGNFVVPTQWITCVIEEGAGRVMINEVDDAKVQSPDDWGPLRKYLDKVDQRGKYPAVDVDRDNLVEFLNLLQTAPFSVIRPNETEIQFWELACDDTWFSEQKFENDATPGMIASFGEPGKYDYTFSIFDGRDNRGGPR